MIWLIIINGAIYVLKYPIKYNPKSTWSTNIELVNKGLVRAIPIEPLGWEIWLGYDLERPIPRDQGHKKTLYLKPGDKLSQFFTGTQNGLSEIDIRVLAVTPQNSIKTSWSLYEQTGSNSISVLIREGTNTLRVEDSKFLKASFPEIQNSAGKLYRLEIDFEKLPDQDENVSVDLPLYDCPIKCGGKLLINNSFSKTDTFIVYMDIFYRSPKSFIGYRH